MFTPPIIALGAVIAPVNTAPANGALRASLVVVAYPDRVVDKLALVIYVPKLELVTYELNVVDKLELVTYELKLAVVAYALKLAVVAYALKLVVVA